MYSIIERYPIFLSNMTYLKIFEPIWITLKPMLEMYATIQITLLSCEISQGSRESDFRSFFFPNGNISKF